MQKLEWITEKRTVNELIPLAINPRKISEADRMKMIESLQRFNLVDIPVIDNDNTVISGHQRLRAMQAIGRGDETIDVRIPNRKLSDSELKEYNLLANTHYGVIDLEVFNEFFANVNVDIVPIDLGKIEFEQSDVFEKLKNKFEKDVEREAQKLEVVEDDFDVPEGGSETDIVLGDLFEIGEHRLLCGDSTSTDAVQMLMGGGMADMVFTDPPYGVSYQSNMRTKTKKFSVLENDNIFITEWINNIPLYSKGFVFIWTSWKVLKQWIIFCENIGELSNLIIWNKGGGGIGDLKKTFSTDFEVALVYNRGAEIKGKRLGSVWDIGKDGSTQYLHPTQKPIELAATAIENITNINDSILDFFLGSGSTMVAAHQLQRKCYGMELDPKYCQVIVDRMRKLDPALIIKRNGIII